MMATNYEARQDGAAGGSLPPRRPENTAFKQQRLPAWQPVLTAASVMPTFFIVGLLFIPVGIGLYVTSSSIKEFEIDYTGVDMSSPCFNCSQNFSWNNTRPCTCTVPFYLDQTYESNVFMYYGLSNFYQNHRRYVKSRDDGQLNGNMGELETLELFYNDPNGTKIPIPLTTTGIAWWTDKYVKFRNPGGTNQNLTAVFQGTTKPVNWHRPVYELEADPENNGFINEDFIVWMRTAALPTFRKLYRIIQKRNGVVPTLPQGNYSLEVVYNYPVRSFDGRKRMILSTISWMGGKNPFLGIAYITVGSLCFLLGIVLMMIHHKYGNRSNSTDITN